MEKSEFQYHLMIILRNELLKVLTGFQNFENSSHEISKHLFKYFFFHLKALIENKKMDHKNWTSYIASDLS